MNELARLFAPLALGVCCVLLADRPAFGADGDLPPQPGDDDAVAPADAPPSRPPASSAAHADWELAASAEYLAPPIRGGTNPFGFGFGGHFGLSVSNVYVGVSVIDYLGGSDVNLSDQALLFGGDLGYGIVLHRFDTQVTLVLRPLLGVGNAAVSHTDPSIVQNAKPDVVTTASGRTVVGGMPSATTTIDNVYLRPALGLILAGGWHFVALEGSAMILPGISYGGADPSTWLTYGARVNLGVRF